MNIERKHKLYLLYPNKYPYPEYEYCKKFIVEECNIETFLYDINIIFNMNIDESYNLLKYYFECNDIFLLKKLFETYMRINIQNISNSIETLRNLNIIPVGYINKYFFTNEH